MWPDEVRFWHRRTSSNSYEAHLAAAQEPLQQSIGTAATLPSAEDNLPAVADLQPATTTTAAAAAAAAAAPTVTVGYRIGSEELLAGLQLVGQQQQQQQQGLRLRIFCSRLPKAVDMLAVLHPRRLAHVVLDLHDATTNTSAMSVAFKRLSSLQQLCLVNMRDASLGSALTALAHLNHLTLLELSGGWPRTDLGEGRVRYSMLEQPVSVALQQLLAQPLPLQKLVLSLDCRLPVLNMAKLTQLTELDTISCQLPGESMLPVQLQRLDSNGWGSADSMAPVIRQQLQQLRHLTLQVEFTQKEPLLQLAQLPTLQHVALQYDGNCMDMSAVAVQAAAATATAWESLPQLRELVIDFGVPSVPFVPVPTQRQVAAIVAGAGAATSLTKLVLYGSDSDSLNQLAAVAACASLTGLTRLQDLSLGFGPALKPAPGDPVALTVLTGLTRLHLGNAE
jgi:hypothetical protein